MSYNGSDIIRISAEYERRAREIPEDFYSWGKPSNLLMHEQTRRSCIRMLQRRSMFPLNGLRVADIGCGVGTWLLEFIQWGVDPTDLGGIDLMPDRLARARRRIPGADLHLGSASELHWPDKSFDLVSQFLVFTTILDPELKREVASEMFRVLKPGGCILWFDFRLNNPWNPEVRGVGAAEIRSLFPDCEVELAPALLAPPLGRLIAGWSWPLAEALHALPFLCTHYAALIAKPRYKESSTEKSAGLPGRPAPNRIL